MITIGIDNGIGGALAMYNSESDNLEVIPMPVVKVPTGKGNKNQYDIPRIIEWFDQFRAITKMVVLEKAQAFPGQGSVSMFSVGRCFGIMEGILASLGMPHRIVYSKSWQKIMFEGIPHEKGKSKQSSVLVAQRLFPKTRFVTGERSFKLHDGMTDAALMAVYASKM